VTRKVLFVSGTRADFGLLESTLRAAAAHPGLEVGVIATGMHLMAEHGLTVDAIAAAGLDVVARIPVDLASDDAASMARATGRMLIGLTDVFSAQRPDLVLVLGDRGEMLAGALAAAYLGIPVAHVHGGERSGTIDESVRHAVSKVAHYHFVATDESRERLVRMGESPESIFITGAPGLDGLQELPRQSRATLAADAGLDASQPTALLVFHPVLQESGASEAQARALVDALAGAQMQVVCLLPNADPGNAAIRQRFLAAESPRFRCHAHLPRSTYLAWMAAADVMVGNSSSGIIEAATFGLPVVNVGQRQQLRERSANVLDCSADTAAIGSTLARALAMRGQRFENVYGSGGAGARIVELLATLPLDAALLKKCNAY
jgi:GDP/UDP-N,N'-diacetylbacillosamine 2-epimerase (hydrolysing)